MSVVKVDTLSSKLCADNNHVYHWLLESCNAFAFSPVELGPSTDTIMWWDESIGSMRTTNYLTWFSIEVPDDLREVLDHLLTAYAQRVEDAPKEAEARRAARKAAAETEAAAKEARAQERRQEAEAKAERKRVRDEKQAAKIAADQAKLAAHQAHNTGAL